MNPASIKIYKTPALVAEALAADLLQVAFEYRKNNRVFHIALSGGNTPSLLFQILATRYKDSMPWNLIYFYWTDERCVPPDDPESNYGMANSLLFSKLNFPAHQVQRIHGENPAVEECKRYSGILLNQLDQVNSKPIFDMVLLGLGEDGHTASIFPNQMELVYSNNICETARHPSSGQARISLTGTTINNARRIAFLVTGKNKARVVKEVARERKQFYPSSHIAPVNGELSWYLDEEAASFGYRGKLGS
jgi:6-phosphogluconolactonase